MFTGIIEDIVEIAKIEKSQSNIIFGFVSNMAKCLKVNQSISHNGACLSVKESKLNEYFVTVVDETIKRTNFKYLKLGDRVNIERAINLSSFLDGHLLQGHVDTVAKCNSIENNKGSYIFTFEIKFREEYLALLIDKGSIAINGISLTIFGIRVIEREKILFNVSIIPYTFERTNLSILRKGDYVNIEFDIIGKYVNKIIKNNKNIL